jgi:ABC-type branched-subunit amino acid transport system ATPase component
MNDRRSDLDATLEPSVMVAQGLCKRYGNQHVLDDVDLFLKRGEVVLLRGANGSGKTTLLNILTGNISPDAGRIRITKDNAIIEDFAFPRPWWRDLNPFDHFTPERIAKEGVARTWQDIRLFPTHSLRENIVLANMLQSGETPFNVLFRQRLVKRDEIEFDTNADKLLSNFELAGRGDSSADKVSLGQAKRVAIARTIQAGARILFLDEPLAALDSRGIQDVMTLLRNLVDEHQTTLVIVEHVFNIPRILDLASTVWTLDQGRVTRENAAAVDPRLGLSEEAVRPWLESVVGAAGRIIDCELPGGATLTYANFGEKDGPPGLEVRDVTISRGRRAIIGGLGRGSGNGLSFALPRGSLGILQAPNGWGKTTFLEAVSGLIPMRSGEIRVYGDRIDRYPPWRRAKAGLIVLQSRDNTFPNLSVRDSLSLAGVDTPPQHLAGYVDRHVSDLSGGQKQNVAITCALAAPAGKVLLLDEPFGMLDSASISRVKSRILKNSNGVALILLPSAAH